MFIHLDERQPCMMFMAVELIPDLFSRLPICKIHTINIPAYIDENSSLLVIGPVVESSCMVLLLLLNRLSVP